MASFHDLIQFLRVHLTKLDYSSGGGDNLKFPDFDLTAFDYLDFAEESLQRSNLADRINCIGNLKRATECQLDTILEVMGLRANMRRPSFPAKMKLVRQFGLASPRSLELLNRLRNELEHEYAEPSSDLTLYFELVSTFVHAIESYVLMLATYGEMDWRAVDAGGGFFSVVYDFEKPGVRFRYQQSREHAEEFVEVVSTEALWGSAVWLFFLMCRHVSLVSAEFVLRRLHSDPPFVRDPMRGDEETRKQ